MGKEDGGEIESESTFMPCGVLLFPFCYQFTIYNQLAITNVFQLDGGEPTDQPNVSSGVQRVCGRWFVRSESQ